MKLKIILCLCIFGLVFTSCSTNDKTDDSTNDEIVGTWGIYEYLEEDGTLSEADPRLSENQITFKQDGSVTSALFEEGQGNWQNLGAKNYSITADGETVVLELLNGGILKTEYGNGEATFMTKVK